MNKRERILAAVHGERVDRVPIALWRHFPHVDQTAEGLARAVIDFQAAYDFDLVKVTPASGYLAEAWGAQLRPLDNEEGTREYLCRPIQSAADWRKLQPLSVQEGVLARELTALALIRQALGNEIFVLATLFSPLTVAKQLSGDAWQEHIRHAAADFQAGLKTITDSCITFGTACLERGADGVFFASQLASYDILDRLTYEAFGLAFDLEFLEALRPRARLVLLHLHGKNPMFELVSQYRPDIVNWHDRETAPSLAQGLEQLPAGAVSGGVDRHGPLRYGNPQETAEQVRDAVRQVRGHRLVVSTGCVMLTTCPPENIRAAREAVDVP